MSSQEIITELPKLTREELERVDLKLHELLGASKLEHVTDRRMGELLEAPSPALVENWLARAIGAALPGITTSDVMAMTRGEE